MAPKRGQYRQLEFFAKVTWGGTPRKDNPRLIMTLRNYKNNVIKVLQVLPLEFDFKSRTIICR